MRKRRWLVAGLLLLSGSFVLLRLAGSRAVVRGNERYRCLLARPDDRSLPANPSVLWRSEAAVRMDPTLSAPCFSDADCTLVSVATDCCVSTDFAVLTSRSKHLRSAVDDCSRDANMCDRKCPPRGVSAACVVGVCVQSVNKDVRKDGVKGNLPRARRSTPLPATAFVLDHVEGDSSSVTRIELALGELRGALQQCSSVDAAGGFVGQLGSVHVDELDDHLSVRLVRPAEPPGAPLVARRAAEACVVEVLERLRLPPAPETAHGVLVFRYDGDHY